MDDYLSKPFRMDELQAIIRQIPARLTNLEKGALYRAPYHYPELHLI